MTLNLDSEDVLYRLACECEELFDQLQETLPKTKLEVTTIDLFAEFQQRFSIWGAHLGVFARKSQCLDTRLRNLPDLQDLVARLLDILRRSLQQCKNEANSQEEVDQTPIGFDESYCKASIQTAALTAIDNTLSRLNRLGVTIRRSSRDKIDTRAKTFAAALDLDSFAYLCAKAVHALYPGAHRSLKDYLSKSMIDRYAKMRFFNSRHNKLETRREPRFGLSPILEVPNNETQTNVAMTQPARAIPVVANLPKVFAALSQSDLSSVNIEQIRRRRRPLDEASSTFHKTTSVQMNQGNYPRPPVANGDSDIFACEWCSEPLSKKTLSESEWRRHIDRDLKPYVCLSEKCAEAHPIYSTFDEWFSHMGLHNRRWHRQVYLSSSWVCTVCEFNPDVYNNPEALHSHLKESHGGDFTSKQLQVISRQSRTAQTRAWNDCLLCCFGVEEHRDSGEAVFPKRRKESSKQETANSAKKIHAMINLDHHSPNADYSDLSSDSDVSSHRRRSQDSKDRSEALARHIAVHLQVLMLLTLRFAALQKDDGVLHDDIKSDSVDIDDGNSVSRGNDLGRLSDIDSQADVSMKDMDGEDNGGDAMDLDDDVVEDVIPIPDTDLDLEDVPRQCDGLAADNDAFLKKVIESGAYQSWREEPARKGPSLSHNDYTIGWICALQVEATAAALMLDKIHPPLPSLPLDKNAYTFGSIGAHNIVIASLPAGAFGNTPAATVGMQLLSSFHAIRFGFMVGIGGGVPSSKADIRLGDIVVSQPTDTSGGVIQYDLGKALSGGQFKRTGMLNRPPKVLLTALATLQAHHLMEDSRVVEFVSNLQDKMAPHNATRFTRPTQEDYLFQAEYDHIASDTCIKCDRSKVVLRPLREHQEPVIHYGLIGSANQVMKDSRRRDQLARDLGVYCVEMEAAGLMNDFPCLVIRGICDYADSHKNKEWQGYAAAVAAAYAKELLLVVAIDQTNSTPTARDTLADSVHRFDVPLDLTAVPVITNFVGRQGELDQLWQYLQPIDPPSRKVAIVHGLGGMGKTQLAIRFARDHKDDFTAIFWLSGKDRGTLLQSLSSILPRLPGQSYPNAAINDEEAEKRARDVLKWLAIEGNSRWLIIFDNIDQYSPFNDSISDAFDIAEFFPGNDHGSILITSRLQGLIELGRSFPIHGLDLKDTIQLLLQNSRLLAKNTAKGLESHPDTVTLASRLGGLPLAIVIAGLFIHETGTSITEYLHYYQASWSDLQLQSNPERQYQQGNILQTWISSYREIQKRDAHAAELLLFLARFDNRDIWYELIKSSHHSSNVPVWLERTISSRLAFSTSIKNLVDFSLLETKEEWGSYTMHPVVQDWCIHLSSRDNSVNSIRLNELALISVGYSVPSSSERNSLSLQQRLVPHANYVRHRDWQDGNFDTALWGAFDGLGNLYSDQGKLKEAEEMYERALAGYENALGPDHTSTLNTVNNFGRLYSEQGKLAEAEEMYQRALAGFEKAFGPDHSLTLEAVGNLGSLYSQQGKLAEAEEMYLRALTGFEEAFGPDHPSTLKAVRGLGRLYSQQGKLVEAEEMYLRALTGFEKAFVPDYSSTLKAVGDLGSLYSKQGKLAEADEMYQRALTGF